MRARRSEASDVVRSERRKRTSHDHDPVVQKYSTSGLMKPRSRQQHPEAGSHILTEADATADQRRSTHHVAANYGYVVHRRAAEELLTRRRLAFHRHRRTPADSGPLHAVTISLLVAVTVEKINQYLDRKYAIVIDPFLRYRTTIDHRTRPLHYELFDSNNNALADDSFEAFDAGDLRERGCRKCHDVRLHVAQLLISQACHLRRGNTGRCRGMSRPMLKKARGGAAGNMVMRRRPLRQLERRHWLVRDAFPRRPSGWATACRP